jgi:VWFA-related protein
MNLRQLACFAAATLALAQQPPASPPVPLLQPPGAVPSSDGQISVRPQQPAAEVAAQDAPLTFQSKVNLVLVTVVVRNSKTGKPAGNLEKQDFLLFDRGKPQTIAKFSVEKAGVHAIAPTPQLERSAEEQALEPDKPGIVVPDHFVAYFFDDIHLEFGDLAQARAAAQKHLATAIGPNDRAAIYTSSGQTQVDFTDDRDKLNDGLLRLQPHPIARPRVQECPDVSFYMADQIVNRNDPQALNAAAQEAIGCNQASDMPSAKIIAQSSAYRAISAGEQESRVALLTLKDMVRRMSAMPGQRTILMISPGFFTINEQRQDETDVIDKAIKANVTISALDARGLYTAAPDASQRTFSIAAEATKQQIKRASMQADADVMAELADGTGGTFVQNTNDLQTGLRDLAATPDVYYVLGFSPQNMKLDGGYHDLKVKLKVPAGFTVKARRGYYAPRHLSSADEDAKEEISQALFSREEMRDIPVEMHTQFFKASPGDARLVVVTRIDVRKLKFRKVDGRNSDDVMVVAGLFDRNGNFVTSLSKILKMKLKDETLTTKLNSGVSVRSDFKVAPGTYVIRLVLRDAEGQMMAAQNGAVEIP